MENRVLTLEEVLALPDGAEVWVEDHSKMGWPDAVHKVALYEHGGMWLNVGGLQGWAVPGFYFGTRYRVWSIPQPPTPAELAANPWP